MSVLFLDIETTGLSREYDDITTIVWYHDNEWGQWICGQSESEALTKHWNDAEHLVTYNGKCFDEPFICRNFEFGKHRSHVDLRYVLARQGIKGGLKVISAAQELERPEAIDQVDGFLAVKLWKAYQAGSQEALDILLYYNAWDVRLLVKLYNRFVSNSIEDTFPNWQMNPHWLDDFLAKNQSSYRSDYPQWQRRAPRSDKDLTLEIVDQLKTMQCADEAKPWFGNVIAFTGQMINRDGGKLHRDEARRIANSVGFVWTDGVKHGCTHLVAANLDLQTTKALKAREIGVTIMTPNEFWDMVELG
jgi:NAD-dependent DNA ligase